MIKLALCDDDAKQLETIGGLLREYAAARPALAIKLSVFSSGQDLLAAAEHCGGFDLYILDVVMPGLSGIELGVRLREKFSCATIIYLTVSSEYAVDSYKARAFYYLVKPVTATLLEQVLDRAAAELEKQKAARATVRTKDGLQLVRLDDIVYAELAGRIVRYHLSDGTCLDSVTVRGSFQEEAAALLADERFFLCGASFAVNLFYVTAVGKGFLQMDGGSRIPLPRRLVAQAKRCWSNYWLGAPEDRSSP